MTELLKNSYPHSNPKVKKISEKIPDPRIPLDERTFQVEVALYTNMAINCIVD